MAETTDIKPLAGQVVLVTGGTRGIGKAIALAAARSGADVAVTYRDPAKQNRAEKARLELEETGVRARLALADITAAADRQALYRAIKESFGRLDGLVLNAAGGLETDKGPDYARLVNRDAQLALVQDALAAGLMPPGGRIIYLTSLWAHRWGHMEPLPGYAGVAQTKYEAEQDLRTLQPALAAQGLKLAIVVGHLITDTGAFTIFKRKDKSLIERLSDEVEGGQLPSPEDVAAATVELLSDSRLESGRTVYVGRPVG